MSGRVIYSNASMVIGKQYPVVQNNSFDEIVSGIYIIQDVSTDRCYVGASKNVAARWQTHRADLMNAYPNYDMRSDFVKHPDNFVFVLIEKCGIDQLEAREVFWVDVHDALNPEWGYNIRKPLYRTKRADFTRIRVPASN